MQRHLPTGPRALLRNPSPHRPVNHRSPAGIAVSWLVMPLLCLSAAAQAATDTDLLVNMNQEPAAGQGPAGGNFKYEVIVRHNTGGAATGALLTDDLPLGATFVSATSPDGVTCLQLPTAGAVIDASNRTALCQVGSVAVNGVKKVVFEVILPTVGSGWRNTATVTHDDSATDPNHSNDSSYREFTVYNAADMKIAVVATPDGSGGNPLRPGQPFKYLVDVTNAGPGSIPADGKTVVSFAVPVGVSVTNAGTNGWSCAPTGYPLTSPGGGQANTVVTCTRPGAVAGSNTAVPQLVVDAAANATGSITATFNVKGYTDASTEMPDGQPANNTQPATVTPAGTGADLSITKAVIDPGSGNVIGNATVAVDDNVTFRLRPRFNGGMLAVGDQLTVTDNLPAELVFVNTTGTNPAWSCGNVGQLVTCTRTLAAPLPANHSDLDDIRITAHVTGTQGGRSNTAAIAQPSLSGDPDMSNNSGTVLLTASTEADLLIYKTASNWQNGVNVAVPLNTDYTYTLNAGNNGPLGVPAGTNITVTDTIPAGVTITVINPGAGWSCTPSAALPLAGNGSSTQVVCTYANALASNGVTPGIVLTAQRTTPGIANNNACVAYPTGTTSRTETNLGNNCRGVGVGANNGAAQPGDMANVGVTKAAAPNPAYAGESLTYTMVVTNAGPAIAQQVELRDVLNNLLSENAAGKYGLVATFPGTGCMAGTTHLSSGIPVHVVGGGTTLVCNLGDIPSGQSRQVTVTVRPDMAKTGSRPNTAYAYAQATVDPDLSNNSATVNSQVIARVDLRADKSANPTAAAAGQPIKYTVAAINDGPSSAQNVWLKDKLPPNTELVGSPAPSSGGSCSVTAGVLDCVWKNGANEYLASGGRYEVLYTLRSTNNQPWTPGRKLDNEVEVGTVTDEPNKTNNKAQASVTLSQPELDILVAMNHSVDAIDLGTETTYTIRVTNAGPSYGTNVVMTDVFPSTNAGGVASSATFSYQGALTVDDPAKGSCTAPAMGATSGGLQCSFPLMAPGEVRVITFKMRAESLPAGAASGSIFHKASVTLTETEYRPGVDVLANNTTHDQTTTKRAAPAPGNEIDLGIVKTTDAAAVVPGAEFNYVLTVRNHSGAGKDVTSAHGAQVLDTLPAGLTFVSAAGCAYDGGTRKVSCAVSSLAAGASTAFTLRVRVDTPYTGAASISNTAEVDMPGDPVNGNNSSTASKNVGNSQPAAIPTLSEWGLIILSMVLAVFALRNMPKQPGRRM